MPIHVVLTQFNIPTKGREGIIRASADWLANRFDLFDAFCFPSMLGQTSAAFRWYIYFDRDTPPAFAERARAYAARMPQLILRFGTLEDFSLESIQDDVWHATNNDKNWVITTRLDNDDALARDYIARIAMAARPGTREVLNVTEGYIWRAGRVYRHAHPSNAFASLSEPLTNLKTIFSTPHMDLASVATIRQIGGGAGWMQVVHDRNVSNRVRGQLVGPAAIRAAFALSDSVEIHDIDPVDLLVDRTLLAPARDARDWGIRQVKKVLRR